MAQPFFQDSAELAAFHYQPVPKGSTDQKGSRHLSSHDETGNILIFGGVLLTGLRGGAS
jgi:hypothetical protein